MVWEYNKYKEEMNLSLYLTLYTKINLRWITNLIIKAKTLKLPEETLGDYLITLGIIEALLATKKNK